MAPFDELSPSHHGGALSAVPEALDSKMEYFKMSPPMAQAETLLAHEHARLLHENNLLRAMHENQRLAQENMMLLQMQSQGSSLSPYAWSPAVGWPVPPLYSQAPVAKLGKPCDPRNGQIQKPHQRQPKSNELPNSTSTRSKEAEVRSQALSICASRGTATEARHSEPEVRPARRTTVMLRGIPIEYTRALLVEMLRAHGYDKKFNLVYMPMDFQNKVGLGYAFINFESTEIAEAFFEQFDGFKDWAMSSDRVCELRWSDVQGLDAHFERYRNSPVMHESVPDEYQPAIFSGSERMPFPPPTKLIRAPRHWNKAK